VAITASLTVGDEVRVPDALIPPVAMLGKGTEDLLFSASNGEPLRYLSGDHVSLTWLENRWPTSRRSHRMT